MNICRVLVCLVMAAFAWPTTIGAQLLPAAASEQVPNAFRAGAYSCVDPSDALARRTIQAEPCRWPMLNLPATAGTGFVEPPRLPTYPSKSTDSEGGHAMFWRFPVQSRGPFDAPRHSFH